MQHPVDEVVGRVEHGELGLGFRAATLGGADDFNVVAFDDFEVHDGRGVVLGVLAGAGRVGQHRGAQRIVRVAVGAADAFVDHLLDAHRRVRPGDLHADLDEDHADAGILADRAMAFGGHPRIGQDLRDGVLGGGAFFAVIGFTERLDVIERVVVADVLEGVGDGLDQVFLFDGGHVLFRINDVFDVAGRAFRSWFCRQLPWPWLKREIRYE